jgi:energy-coupling factor transport system ATP-binding protein
LKSSAPPVIKVEQLSHTYPDGTNALEDVDSEIERGEFIGIIGQNGSGKTTLVKHFNGLLKPTKGRVLVDSVDTREKTIAYLSTKVGYVFQNPDHQISQETTEAELAFGPRNLGLSPTEIDHRVKEALRSVGIEHLATRHPLLTSKAERQMIAIASVLTMKPDVIIVDEPTTGQDKKQSRQTMKMLADLNAAGHTVIIITHDMSLAAEYTRRVIVFHKGKIILDGPPKNVFKETGILRESGLRPPQITRLTQMLQPCGFSPDVTSVAEMYDEFKRVYGSS